MSVWHKFRYNLCFNETCILKNARSTLQKTIIWTKNSGKGRQEWEKACIEAGLPSRSLKTPVKTPFASKVTPFQETLDYASAINICY